MSPCSCFFSQITEDSLVTPANPLSEEDHAGMTLSNTLGVDDGFSCTVFFPLQRADEVEFWTTDLSGGNENEAPALTNSTLGEDHTGINSPDPPGEDNKNPNIIFMLVQERDVADPEISELDEPNTPAGDDKSSSIKPMEVQEKHVAEPLVTDLTDLIDEDHREAPEQRRYIALFLMALMFDRNKVRSRASLEDL
ncbi:MAG: hypothetical protein LQ340_007858 [Diploschistes diacapsis]|nr:MAG: hypothetical protein LQ340_007858 [Diploschistes diacapsis]